MACKYNLFKPSCLETRSTDEWCTFCREQFEQDFDSLKKEEDEEAKEREFDERSAMGCI